MTCEEINLYNDLDTKFNKAAERAVQILKKSRKRENEGIAEASEFKIYDDEVYWKGVISCRGEQESVDGFFPIDYLSMTDKELEEAVKKENEEYERFLNNKEKEKQEREKNKRREMYEKLKKEFG